MVFLDLLVGALLRAVVWPDSIYQSVTWLTIHQSAREGIQKRSLNWYFFWLKDTFYTRKQHMWIQRTINIHKGCIRITFMCSNVRSFFNMLKQQQNSNANRKNFWGLRTTGTRRFNFSALCRNWTLKWQKMHWTPVKKFQPLENNSNCVLTLILENDFETSKLPLEKKIHTKAP